MKRKVLMIMLGGFMVLGLATGCNKNNDEFDIVSGLKEYISTYNKLNGKSYEEYYSPKDFKFLDSNIDGLLSAEIYDLDNDKQEEAIVFSMKDNKLSLEYLEVEDNNLIKKNTTELEDFLPYIDKFDINAFAVKINNQVKIFLEINGSSSIIADGSLYKLVPMHISENKIVLEEKIGFEASALYEQEVKDYINKVKNTGLEMNTIEDSILNQNKKALKLFSIKRKHLSDFNVSNYFNSKESKVKYGVTSIRDFMEKEYKMHLENINHNFKKGNNKESEYSDDYLGNYIWKSENDSIQFQLIKEDGEVRFYMSYYPDNSIHASEEICGTWSTEKNIKLVNNENQNALGTYSFNNIKYSDRKIIIDIKINEILTDHYQDFVIPNGNYIFIKI